MSGNRTILTLAALALALGATTAVAAEGLILRQRTTVSSQTDAPREQMLYYMPSLRVMDDANARTITNLDKRTLTVLNKKDKTYSIITFAEISKRSGSHDERVQGLPPNVRNMIHADATVRLQPTGKSETVAGYATKEYQIVGAGIDGTIWIADSLDFGSRAKEWNALTPIFGGQHSPGGHLDEAVAKMKGIPLRRTVTMEPLPMVTTEVLEVRRGDLPAEMVTIPQEFTKVEPLSGPRQKPTPAP